MAVDRKPVAEKSETQQVPSQGAIDSVNAPPKPLNAALADNPKLQALVSALRDEQSCPLTYASMADRGLMKTVQTEILRQVCEIVDRGELASLRLHHYQDPSWESGGADGHVRLNAIGRCASTIKRVLPHSISMVSVAPAPAGVGEAAWNFCPAVSTLEFVRVRDQERIAVRPFPRTSTVNYGTRPTLPMEEAAELGEGSVRGIIDSFMGMHARWVKEYRNIARDEQHPSWRNDVIARRLGSTAIRALMPMKKAFFSAGLGDLILRVALTTAHASARAAKKDAAAFSRDQVVRLLWDDAHTYGRAKPPFVEF